MSAKKGHIQKCQKKCCSRYISPCQGDVNPYVPKNEAYGGRGIPLHVCNYHANSNSRYLVENWSVIEHDPQNKECIFE